MLAFLCNGWVEEKVIVTEDASIDGNKKEEERMYLKLHEDIVPYKVEVSIYIYTCLHYLV